MDWDLLYNLDNVMMQRMKDKTYLVSSIRTTSRFSKIHQMVYGRGCPLGAQLLIKV